MNRSLQVEIEKAAPPPIFFLYGLFLFWTIKYILYNVKDKTVSNDSLCWKLYQLRH